ncbi:MAG: CehA/McbA family metallohydrolase [Mariniphaga sp.]
MKKLLVSLLFTFSFLMVFSQDYNIQYQKFDHLTRPEVRNPIQIPNIQGYITMKCDFHMHTYFSDGEVTPSMRIKEAWSEGLDAIAITEHNKIKDDQSNADLNKSYFLAKRKADETGLLLIRAIEYTDKNEVGHMNFLFIDDANQYARQKIEPEAAVELAASKGAFVIYNHPGWPDKNSDLSDFQKKFIAQKKIGAIEVFNEMEFYPQTIDFCLDNQLAPVGCSDVHPAIGYQYDLNVVKRPMTLVFAKEATLDGIKEALLAGRSLAYSNNLLAGKAEYIIAVFDQSLKVQKITEIKEETVFNVTNTSDITFILSADGEDMVFPGGKVTQIRVKKADFSKTYSMKNGFCGAKKYASVSLPLK